MKRLLLMVALVCCGALWLTHSGVAQPDDKTQSDASTTVGADALMQAKLKSAQKLLEGLALENYESIETEAQRLQLLSLDASWNTIQTKDYARSSAEFRNAADKIRSAGKNENLDAAGLGYVKLTLTCIECHRHVRANQKKGGK